METLLFYMFIFLVIVALARSLIPVSQPPKIVQVEEAGPVRPDGLGALMFIITAAMIALVIRAYI